MSRKKIMFAMASPGGVAREALEKAVRITKSLDAELELFHCVFERAVAASNRAFSMGITQDIQQVVEHRRWQLENNARALRHRGVPVRVSIRWDFPVYEGIVRQVLRHKPDLLIVQSTARRGIARAISRDTNFNLIESCPCPLLIIKSLQPYSGSGMVAAVDPGRSHGKPLSLDDAVIRAASLIAEALSEDLHVYHACRPWDEVARTAPQLRRIPEIEQADARSAYRDKAEQPLRELASRYNISPHHIRVVEAGIGEALPAFAKAMSADIVAFGAVSRPLLKRVLIGHTAERLLDRLACDVLVVKSPDFRSPVAPESVHRTSKNAALRGRYVW